MIAATPRCVADCFTKVDRTWLFRGSKSRNKVSVGEPAEGSLTNLLGPSGPDVHRAPAREFACRRACWRGVRGSAARAEPVGTAAHIAACAYVLSLQKHKQLNTTFNNGSLGSCNDEERSEMRNVMRFARPVSHRVFERTWHPLGLPAGIPV